MRFHFRRLLPLALSSTFVTLILLYSLRPSQDDDPAAQPRYKEPQNQKTNGESLKDELMSENIAGSLNEQIRREFVHLPSLEHAGSGGVETLWWSSSTDHPTDRILAQMRHVPKNYQRDQQTPLKTIYMPGGLGNEPEGQEKFLSEQCPVNVCRLTADHLVALTAEMRLLHAERRLFRVHAETGRPDLDNVPTGISG